MEQSETINLGTLGILDHFSHFFVPLLGLDEPTVLIYQPDSRIWIEKSWRQ
jgi:hypothetical protein